MEKKKEVITALDNVINKGNTFIGKATDLISAVEILLVAASGLKVLLEKTTGGNDNE